MLTTACSNNEDINIPSENPVSVEAFGQGSNLVSFTLKAESAVSTRDANADLLGNHIGDGSKANVLIFAVYESSDYDATKADEATWTLAPEFAKPTSEPSGITLGEGQNALNITQWPVTIQLATDPDKTYRVAFWAQNNTTTAFLTQDLTNVRILYPTINDDIDSGFTFFTSKTNNDEYRDAFCKTSDPFAGNSKTKQEVVLRRPFAQINVGTTGADYKNLLLGEKVYPNRTFQYSQIVLKGAANKIDVFNDEISTTDDFKDAIVKFEWQKLPAYQNVPNIPTYNKDAVVGEGEDKYVTGPWADLLSVRNEEFLKVHLDSFVEGDTDKHDFKPYLVSYPTMKVKDGEIKEYYTETFKYLSMCYVLVPASHLPEGDQTLKDGDQTYAKTVLDEVHVYFAENPDGTDKIYNSTNTTAGRTYVNLLNVPVQRNWRTNILGGLAWIKDQTDPQDPTPDPDDPNVPGDGPDDPTSIFNTSVICIHRDPIFINDYDGIHGENPELEWRSNKEGQDSPVAGLH